MQVKMNLKIALPFLAMFVLFGCSGAKVKGPGMEFDKAIYNFGEVPEKAVVDYTFTVTNTGTEILTIKDLVLSCWCMSVVSFDRIVEPGKSGKITGTVATEGFQGKIVKTITVKTNIPDKEPMLTIEGKVLVKVEVEPLPLALGQVDSNTAALKGDVRLTNLTGKPMLVTGIVPPNKNTDVKLTVVEPDKEFSLQITVRPPFKTGSKRETIIVKTNLADAPEVNVYYDYSSAP